MNINITIFFSTVCDIKSKPPVTIELLFKKYRDTVPQKFLALARVLFAMRAKGQAAQHYYKKPSEFGWLFIWR
ncbi:hypothetical protein BW900_16385 [Bacillus mycoides]|uniref:Uncharacterized protein n=1 Tax=Bacillus mycoides TaxID=1405 RepID=A0A1S9T6L4_BACMY|nr:hypothetical protein BW900_16385 [Bacillus mycoides]